MKTTRRLGYSSLSKRNFASTARRREIRELQELPERSVPSFFETQRHDLLSLQWPGPPRNILLVKKEDTAAATNALLEFAQHIHSTYPSISCLLEPEVASALHDRLPFPVHAPPPGSPIDPSLLPRKVDLTATFGGDGTILHAASLFSTSKHVPPILAFSMGTLGFLGEWKFHEYKRAFREVYMSGAPGGGDRSSVLGKAREHHAGNSERELKSSNDKPPPHEAPTDRSTAAAVSEVPYKPPFIPSPSDSKDHQSSPDTSKDGGRVATGNEAPFKPPFNPSPSNSGKRHERLGQAPKASSIERMGNETADKPPGESFIQTANSNNSASTRSSETSATTAAGNEIPYKPPFSQPNDRHHTNPNFPPTSAPSSSLIPQWPSLPGLSLGNRPARVLLRSRLRITIHPPQAKNRPHSPPNPPPKALHALNDLTLHRSPSPHLTSLALSLSTPSKDSPIHRPTPLTTLHSDGLVLSTPTGSTAYSLSAGGSIIHPLVNSIMLTPICPRSLSFRPLVLPGDMHVHINLDQGDRSGRVMIGVDGVEVKGGLEKGGTVVVTGEELHKEELEVHEAMVTKWSGGVPCLMRGGGGSGEGETDDGWVGGLNGLLKFNYPFGEEG